MLPFSQKKKKKKIQSHNQEDAGFNYQPFLEFLLKKKKLDKFKKERFRIDQLFIELSFVF